MKEAKEVVEKGIEAEPDNADMKALLEQIDTELSLETAIPLDHPARLKFQGMIDWMLDEGADFSQIKIIYYTANYRGVHANKAIRPGEQVLYVPKNLLITLDACLACPLAKKITELGLDQKLEMLEHNQMSAYILQEMNDENSYWKTYIDMLPKDMTEYPFLFSEEEKTWLEGSLFLLDVEEKIRSLKHDYEIMKEVPEFGELTFEKFSELRTVVGSRVF